MARSVCNEEDMNFVNPSVEILKNKELYIFDMDGTIYLGNQVFDFAVRFIKNLKAANKRVLFFTNNPTRSDSAYIEKLTKLGFPAEDGDVMTSGDVTAEFLCRYRKESSIYLLGCESLYDDFCKKGINLVEGDADIVVSSFDKTLTYDTLNHAARLIKNGAEFLCTHPDMNCPTENGPVIDSGAIVAALTAFSGKSPKYFGKPYRETIDMISEVTGVSLDKMCIFGDRLYTDIALGKRYGVTATLVLTGETTMADVEAAEAADRPDFVFESLDEVDKAIFN